MGRYCWNATVDAAVERAIGELLAEFPGSQVSVRELQDDRGVVAIAVTVGDGRLITAARAVELAPVDWPWALADGVVGLLPRCEFPTVDEFVGALDPGGTGVGLIGDIFGAVTGVFSGVAGWAVDSVIAAITSWVLGGVITMIEAVWSVIDMSTSPQVDAGWFSGEASSPFQLAVGIGGVMLALTLLAAVIRAVVGGSPGGISRAVGVDLPLALLTMLGTIGFTQLALDVSDAIATWVWAGTRDDAKGALDALAAVMRTGMPNTHFLGVAAAIVVLLALLFLWIVLYVREALIYLVIVFSAAFAWPMMVFPPLRDTAKKAGELLLALIICKPVIALAMSVGVSALGGLEAADSANPIRQLGTVVVGAIVFGLAAFMPFLVWKLMPVVAAAVVAQGVASGPMRAAQQGLQMQFYGRQLAAGGRVHGAGAATAAKTAAGPVGVAATATELGTKAVRNTVEQTADAATGDGRAA